MNSYVGISEAEAKHLHELISTLESDGSDSEMEEIDEDFDSSSSSEDEVVDTPGPSKRRRTQDADVPDFTWISDNNFVPLNHTFDHTNSGFHPSQNLTDDNILTYFQCFFTQELAEGQIDTLNLSQEMQTNQDIQGSTIGMKPSGRNKCIRKTMKWYKKVFFHLVDLAVTNSHAMYKVKTGSHMSLADFQLELIRQIIEKFLKEHRSKKYGRPCGDVPIRLVGRHFPKLIPAVPGGKKNLQRICHVCKHTELGPKRRKDTRYTCEECDVALCLIPCFEKYHTVKRF
ncbi:hypothetical protein ILUMI_20951 [Ignelater luminosus]|uniref:PiggyBac transposable element-derived protein 4 C-terminal zinc-finger domain-containing protein n=1 Tax=Ignelater luminosus TaxID=2038154 RepID=A0A8K0CJU3_IGNLU|nr:hypothetical protein ILUMI_20951 [Ignelater luminosus]